MRLSLSELRKIIKEEADVAEPVAAPDAAPVEEPAAAPAAAAGVPEASDDAASFVKKIGLSTDLDDEGGDTPGSGLAKFITMLENQSPGVISKLSEPKTVARMIQTLGDNLTLEILEVTNVALEGMPSKEEFKKRLQQTAADAE